MRRPAALLLLALLAGCRERPPAHLTGDSAAAGISVDPQTVPGRVALELWTLRPGISLLQWSSANLNDFASPQDTQRLAEFLGNWCAVSTRVSDVGGRRIIRQAWFYTPEPPAGLALPDSGSTELARDCTLGLIVVRIPLADSAQGAGLADSVRAQLDAIYDTDSAAISFFGSAFWSHAARFRKGAVRAVSALRAPPVLPAPADSARPVRDVIALAVLPVSGVAIGPDEAFERDPLFQPPDTIPLDSAARLAGLDTALAAPLLRLVAAVETARGDRRPAAGDSLLRPLRRWVSAAEAAPPPRRAAALYLADQVLDRTQCAFALCEPGDSATLAPLRALGAEFQFSELGGSLVYTRSWLNAARALDRDGPLGQLILLQQMGGAFDFSGTCQRGSEGFRRVIDNGERYLERVPQSPIAGAVHFYVAEAYRDIVALAQGAADIYADSSAYSAEAPPARARALVHYRAAIAADPASATASAAWRRAWRLLAGLPLRSTRFYCIYD